MLYKPFKITPSNNGKVYFASDFHYNHQRDFIWTPRGFSSFQAHDKFLEEQCKQLTHDDILIYLGDFSLNSTEEQTFKLLNMIKARVFYIFGNHEGVMGAYYKRLVNAWMDRMTGHCPRVAIYPLSVFEECHDDEDVSIGSPGYNETSRLVFFGEEETFNVAGHHYYCRHMAPLIWDKMKYDTQYCLIGHSHGNCQAINLHAKEGKILDVGVDNAIKYNGSAFLSSDEVATIMKGKKVKIHDHHGDDGVH